MIFPIFIGEHGEDLTGRLNYHDITDKDGKLIAILQEVKFEDDRTQAELLIDEYYFQNMFMEILRRSIFHNEGFFS